MTRPTLTITPYSEGYQLTVKGADGVRHYYASDAEHCRSLVIRFAAEGIVTGRDPLATMRLPS
jgi:hypothetical protein